MKGGLEVETGIIENNGEQSRMVSDNWNLISIQQNKLLILEFIEGI